MDSVSLNDIHTAEIKRKIVLEAEGSSKETKRTSPSEGIKQDKRNSSKGETHKRNKQKTKRRKRVLKILKEEKVTSSTTNIPEIDTKLLSQENMGEVPQPPPPETPSLHVEEKSNEISEYPSQDSMKLHLSQSLNQQGLSSKIGSPSKIGSLSKIGSPFGENKDFIFHGELIKKSHKRHLHPSSWITRPFGLRSDGTLVQLLSKHHHKLHKINSPSHGAEHVVKRIEVETFTTVDENNRKHHFKVSKSSGGSVVGSHWVSALHECVYGDKNRQNKQIYSIFQEAKVHEKENIKLTSIKDEHETKRRECAVRMLSFAMGRRVHRNILSGWSIWVRKVFTDTETERHALIETSLANEVKRHKEERARKVILRLLHHYIWHVFEEWRKNANVIRVADELRETRRATARKVVLRLLRKQIWSAFRLWLAALSAMKENELRKFDSIHQDHENAVSHLRSEYLDLATVIKQHQNVRARKVIMRLEHSFTWHIFEKWRSAAHVVRGEHEELDTRITAVRKVIRRLERNLMWCGFRAWIDHVGKHLQQLHFKAKAKIKEHELEVIRVGEENVLLQDEVKRHQEERSRKVILRLEFSYLWSVFEHWRVCAHVVRQADELREHQRTSARKVLIRLFRSQLWAAFRIWLSKIWKRWELSAGKSEYNEKHLKGTSFQLRVMTSKLQQFEKSHGIQILYSMLSRMLHVSLSRAWRKWSVSVHALARENIKSKIHKHRAEVEKLTLKVKELKAENEAEKIASKVVFNNGMRHAHARLERHLSASFSDHTFEHELLQRRKSFS